jgi:hypothetical protein
MRNCGGVHLAVLMSLAGCAAPRSVLDVLPQGSLASPWNLDGEIWAGPFDMATPALGHEAEGWRKLDPQWAWLALYRHAERTRDTLAVRVFAMKTAQASAAALASRKPADSLAFKAGDEGCWLRDGVLFRMGRLVIEIFARSAGGEGEPMQAVFLSAFIENKLEPALADNPR